ncbi:hypothetical protein JT358_10255 [Micrococcales bacterium 31B]|nr:hypothetical protein [Micrococcales bacterium 31B]
MSTSPSPDTSSTGSAATLEGAAPDGDTLVAANTSPVLEPLLEEQNAADVAPPMTSASLAAYCTKVIGSPQFAGVHVAFPAAPSPQHVWLMNELRRAGAVVSQGCAADFRPEIIIDANADVTLELFRHRERYATALRGVIEFTGEGARKFKKLESNAAIPVPVYSLNTARVLNSTALQRATAQATVQQVARLCGQPVRKLKIAVAGYQGIGHIIADYARHQGARTFVLDTDPLLSLDAHTVGHQVGRASMLLPEADVVIVADAVERYTVINHLDQIGAEALIADIAGPGLDTTLTKLASSVESTRVGYTVYTIGDRVYRVANELNSKAPHSAIRTEEVEIAVVVALMRDLLMRPVTSRKVHRVPGHVDQEIAAAQLQTLGITIDTLA